MSMPAQEAMLTDEKIASVMTYVRASFGNTGGPGESGRCGRRPGEVRGSQDTLDPAGTRCLEGRSGPARQVIFDAAQFSHLQRAG